ncbi:MAG: hypothetical protein MZV70_02405 [Desulfobacterales bacterium]|nr:hypothetical protein [Desulfobacterales bacterium]
MASFALIAIFVGCSTSGDSEFANLDGTWQNQLNQQKLVLKMSGDLKTIAIGDKALPVTIKKVQPDTFMIHVSDKTLGERVGAWRESGTIMASPSP